MNGAIKDFIEAFSKEVEGNNAAIFAGAGLSVPAGFVDWKSLIEPLAKEIGLDVRREENLIAVAQFHYNEHGYNRNRLNQILVNEFSDKARLTENHSILVRLPIATYWTTNYDKLIETALERAGKVPDVKYTTAQLAITRPRRDAIVYKMHGDVDHSDKAILTKDDYESYHVKMAAYITALSGDLVSKTFLFIGFSFSDPNLDYILSRIRITYTENQRRHYCFLKAGSQQENESKSDFEYRRTKQALFVNDLKRFNIKALIVDKYEEITEILRQIELKYKHRSIFVSGSAHDFGRWKQDEAERLIHGLSAELVKKQYRIISGFGLGVGSAVINGVLETIYSNKAEFSDDQLILRPFPQRETGEAKLSDLWEQYRQDMIAHAGIAIFLFGNKIDKDGKVVEANGLEREFRIAVNQGCRVIPVGSTGYVAEKLFVEVQNNLDKFYPKADAKFRAEFDKLGEKTCSASELIKVIVTIVELIRKS